MADVTKIDDVKVALDKADLPEMEIEEESEPLEEEALEPAVTVDPDAIVEADAEGKKKFSKLTLIIAGGVVLLFMFIFHSTISTIISISVTTTCQNQ